MISQPFFQDCIQIAEEKAKGVYFSPDPSNFAKKSRLIRNFSGLK